LHKNTVGHPEIIFHTETPGKGAIPGIDLTAALKTYLPPTQLEGN